MKRKDEKGSALVFSLILVLVLSVMAASLTFLSRSETFSGQNYRMMTQARYGAEAGVNAAANFLVGPNYVPPVGDPVTQVFPGFDTTKYPITLAGGGWVFLSTLAGQGSTYPNAAMRQAFRNAAKGTLPAGTANVNYSVSAQLMSMVSIVPFGSTTPTTVQTWQITAHGDLSSVHNAQAEVVTVLERQITPTFAYAAFADANGCAALDFTGNGTTDSYDSATLAVSGAGIATAPATFNNYGGNVGTNGNETDSGTNVQINGTLSSPNGGIGTCTAGNITAFTGKSLSQVTGGLVPLPQAITFPTPSIPPPGTSNINNSATLSPTSDPANCLGTTCSYGDINLSGGKILTLTPGTYNINSLSITGNAQVVVAPYPPGTPNAGQYGPVIINVTGNNQTTPVDLEGNGVSNPTYDPSMLQILYAGTGTLKIAGNGASAAVVYAPNSTADFKGNGAFYGSVIAKQLLDVGNGALHYDLKLKKQLFTIGNYTLNTFTWNKY